MKTTLFAFLFSTSLLACPDLSGTYLKCQTVTGAISPVENLTVTQVEQTYTFTSGTAQTFVADGVTRTTQTLDNGRYIQIAQTFRCDENVVKSFTVMTMGSATLAEITMDLRKTGNILETKMNGTLMGNEIFDTQTCE
jgi:hypothetical protein